MPNAPCMAWALVVGPRPSRKRSGGNSRGIVPPHDLAAISARVGAHGHAIDNTCGPLTNPAWCPAVGVPPSLPPSR